MDHRHTTKLQACVYSLPFIYSAHDDETAKVEMWEYASNAGSTI